MFLKTCVSTLQEVNISFFFFALPCAVKNQTIQCAEVVKVRMRAFFFGTTDLLLIRLFEFYPVVAICVSIQLLGVFPLILEGCAPGLVQDQQQISYSHCSDGDAPVDVTSSTWSCGSNGFLVSGTTSFYPVCKALSAPSSALLDDDTVEVSDCSSLTLGEARRGGLCRRIHCSGRH